MYFFLVVTLHKISFVLAACDMTNNDVMINDNYFYDFTYLLPYMQ